MCVALLVDPQGDPELLAARRDAEDARRLDSQDPERAGTRRLSPDDVHHPGQRAGATSTTTKATRPVLHRGRNGARPDDGGKDTRMLDAAKRLADCWVKNIGPAPKKAWYEGHRNSNRPWCASPVSSRSGRPRPGRKYVDLAKFLLDSRGTARNTTRAICRSRAIRSRRPRGAGVYSYSGMATSPWRPATWITAAPCCRSGTTLSTASITSRRRGQREPRKASQGLFAANGLTANRAPTAANSSSSTSSR